MRLYGGIDLHSNKHVLTIIDEQDRRVYERRLANELSLTRRALEPYRGALVAVAVESTFNWYWLVDGLMDCGYGVRLVNTAAVKQYAGLKHSDDRHDAFWLAHLLRLGILPTGYIYPKAERGLRDLARQRTRLVQHRSSHLTSVQNQIWRSTGVKISARVLKDMSCEAWPELADEETRLSIDSARAVIATLSEQIERLEERLRARVQLAPAFRQLLSVSGIGPILALTIMLEVGDIGRFPSVGQFACYCRCVESKRISNGKKKGAANRQCGNPYLAWAFHEAAHFALRYLPQAKRFYERKRAERNQIVAVRALAHKMARASYDVLRDRVAFCAEQLFAA